MKRIITVMSKRTGAGKTAVAVNLAAAFSAGGTKTGLLDLNNIIYDTRQALNASGDHTVKENFFPENYLEKMSGLYLFWSPDAFKVIGCCGDMLDTLVIDTDGMPDEELLEASGGIIIATTLEQSDIKQTLAVSQRLLDMGYPAQSLNIIVNRADNSIISVDDVQSVFKNIRVLAVLPFKKEVEQSQAKGEIYFLKDKNDGFTMGIKAAADAIKECGCGRAPEGQRGRDTKVYGINPDESRCAASDIDFDSEGEIKKAVHLKLFDEIDVKNLEKDALTHPEKKIIIHEEIKVKIKEILDRMDGVSRDRKERERLIKEIFEEVVGLGAVEDFLSDAEVSEVMVNRHDLIYIEKKGKLIRTGKRFTDDENVLRAIERIVLPLGRRIDESMPYVDARLPDGSRVNAVIPPLAIDGPVLTIRKFSNKKLTSGDLVKFGSITPEAVDYLKAAVRHPKNILISGGTGSGKTTLLNVLSSFIPDDERIITVEDSAELKLTQEHVVRLEARPANIEGKGAVTIRDLVRNCLRMRPDRIVVGECRGGETLDMLQAMNTGHEGSMTTVHANTPRDALSRIDVMVLMSGVELPLRAIREQIKSAINIVVQQARLKDGSRKVTHISEITGMEGDTILMHDVFKLQQTGETADGKVIGELKRVDRI
jgi:pilus assembly protein CpaF